MPKLMLSETQQTNLKHGRAASAEGLTSDGISRLYSADDSLFGIGEVTELGQIKTHKMFVDV